MVGSPLQGGEVGSQTPVLIGERIPRERRDNLANSRRSEILPSWTVTYLPHATWAQNKQLHRVGTTCWLFGRPRHEATPRRHQVNLPMPWPQGSTNGFKAACLSTCKVDRCKSKIQTQTAKWLGHKKITFKRRRKTNNSPNAVNIVGLPREAQVKPELEIIFDHAIRRDDEEGGSDAYCSRGSEVSMEQRWNTRGATGVPRENPPTSGIVRHDFQVRKSGSDPAGNRTRLQHLTATLVAVSPCFYENKLTDTYLEQPSETIRVSREERGYETGMAGRSGKMDMGVGGVNEEGERAMLSDRCSTSKAFRPGIKRGRLERKPQSATRWQIIAKERSLRTGRFLYYTPYTKVNRVRFPVGPLADFRKWESYRTTPLVCWFSQGSPVPPPPTLHSGAAPYSPCFTLIGSQDLHAVVHSLCTSLRAATGMPAWLGQRKHIAKKWSEALRASKQTPPGGPSAFRDITAGNTANEIFVVETLLQQDVQRRGGGGGVPSADMRLVSSLRHRGQCEVGPQVGVDLSSIRVDQGRGEGRKETERELEGGGLEEEDARLHISGFISLMLRSGSSKKEVAGVFGGWGTTGGRAVKNAPRFQRDDLWTPHAFILNQDAINQQQRIEKRTAAEVPSTGQLTGTSMSKQRADIGQHKAGSVVFAHPTIIKGRTRMGMSDRR
ncbi:hypothetical protein PR048_022828 [Dryococelus australis]|uniref:Ribosomal protein S3 n=1 Tax=Dryococelus australis TaxID=614101 RepID=A0ABQ9GSF3_9NEOP|nr:hypothetical protein PR048_022828 [Dryococelus australis]